MEVVDQFRFLTGDTVAECLGMVPIIRGADKDSHAQDWMIVGCGRKLAAAKELADQITPSCDDIDEEWHKWADLLTLEFVQFVRHTKFARYKCPECSLGI